jgi:hypothetical protein
MSSLFYGRWKQYFQMPIAEAVEHLSLSAYRYYGFLCREMNARSACQLEYSNAEIAERTRIKDHKTIKKARRELQAARLIHCYKVPPGVYRHVMLDEIGDPIPPPPDRKGIRHYSASDTRRTARKSRETRIAPAPRQEPSVTTSSVSTAGAMMVRQCRTHGGVPHWKRGEDWLCESCHPNPHLPERWHPPTAGELGFK